jgi:hypothetical protein
MQNNIDSYVEHKVINKSVVDLIPYANNSRTHSEEQIAQIAATIKEKWAFCVENDCYAVGVSGTVYRVCRRQRSRAGNLVEKYETIILNGSTEKDGYRTYKITVDGVKKHLKGHRLVMNAFYGERKGMVVNHKDGNKQNNTIENLEFVTVAQNNAHAIKTGLCDPSKSKLKNTKVFKKDYAKIYELSKTLGYSRIKIAKMYNCSRQTIDKAINTVRDDYAVKVSLQARGE